MYQRKCQANGQASEGSGTFFLIGSPQYDQHENKCEDRLSDKSLQHLSFTESIRPC